MTVVEDGALQTRYGRASDRFKATWTMHQFASGAFRHFLGETLACDVDFTHLYERIKAASSMMSGVTRGVVRAKGAPLKAVEDIEGLLGDACDQLLAADARLGPSLLRRFFERLKPQDEEILELLIKFYLYADAVEGDRRDKLDYLFTRLGQDVTDSLSLRQRLLGLVEVLNVAEAPRSEVTMLIRAIGSLRDEIESAERFDDLAERNLLRDARTFKHRVGDLYFDPDVLLAIIQLNIAAKDRFLHLYLGEEQRLLQDADKLMEHGQAIERNFGDANPELVEEIARFRELRERFDSLRAQSNVKHDVVTRLKASMNNILAQLDRGLDPDVEPEEIPEDFFDATRYVENIETRFGRGEPLINFLVRIAAGIDGPSMRDLRLETWEAEAYHKLFDGMPAEAEEDDEELWTLYLRAAALRIKVDEEATIMATAMAAGVRPDADLLSKAKRSLDLAKELDEQFGDFLQEAVYYSNRKILHQLYRSRFRLLRGFSGLWLIYDRQS